MRDPNTKQDVLQGMVVLHLLQGPVDSGYGPSMSSGEHSATTSSSYFHISMMYLKPFRPTFHELQVVPIVRGGPHVEDVDDFFLQVVVAQRLSS